MSLTAEIAQTLKTNIEYGAGSYVSEDGIFHVTYLPDEGVGYIDIKNPNNLNFKELSKLAKTYLNQLPEGKWEFNPDTAQKGRIYRDRIFKGVGNVKANPNMPNNALILDNRTMTTSKNTLLEQFKQKILANKKAGKPLRDGIPPTFTGSDGVLYRLEKVTQFADEKVKNPVFKDVAKGKIVDARRATAIKLQTSENVELFDKTKALEQTNLWKLKPDKMEAHHIRMVKMYEPFYQGLSPTDAKELTEWFVKNKYPLGDAKANLILLDENFHGILHKWMQENQIQVYPDKTGKGNFIPGKNPGDLFIRGGAKGQPPSAVNAVFPTESIGKTLAERKVAAKLFLENVQAPIEKKLSELVWDQQLKYNPLTQAEFDNQLSVLNDPELALERRLAKNMPTDVTKGRPLGGLRNTLKIGAGALGTAGLASLTSPTSAHAIGSMTADGVNKKNLKQLGIGIGTDLLGQGLTIGLAKAAGAKIAGPVAGALGAPLIAGPALLYGAHQGLDAFTKGQTAGLGISDIAKLNKQKHDLMIQQGDLTKWDLRRNARHGNTSANYTRDELRELASEYLLKQEEKKKKNKKKKKKLTIN